jgi:hypothetical protein
MTNLDPRIEAVRAKYELEQTDFWKIPQNGQWVCKHAALEVVAVKAKVEWMPPMIIEKDAPGLVTSMVVTGRMGERIEWATGETNPTNYSVKGKQPAYPWAMSEKRAKDRVVLKLVGIHGLVYSEDEMPAVETPERSSEPRVAPTSSPLLQDRVENGQPTSSGTGVPPGQKATAQRGLYDRLSKANRDLKTIAEFNDFWDHKATQAAYWGFPDDWKSSLDAEKRDKEAELSERAKAAVPPEATLDKIAAGQDGYGK